MLHAHIQDAVFRVMGFRFDGQIFPADGETGVYVRCDGKNAWVGTETAVLEARGYFRLAMEWQRGSRVFEIREKPAFTTCGPMLDMSRGSVMKPEAVKKYIDIQAALGMNMLMLYTEDVYEVEEYPMFGYLRGRYSLAELQDIDEYAARMGVELIPCIQTLGHLEKYLRWPEADGIRENERVLLPETEKTYRFIEAEIRAIRKAFRSRKIHLGMDEAWGLGRGYYLIQHGLQSPWDIFCRHLERVTEIARRYFDEPMIWSDMLFQYDGKLYDPDGVLTQAQLDSAPRGVNLVFWDYYHLEHKFYANNLIQHRRMDGKTAFAGGLWTWDGAAPNFRWTLDSMKPALTACLEQGIETVIATQWGNVGECDYFKAVAGLAIFSEYCYRGLACTDADIYAVAQAIGGVDQSLFEAISDYDLRLPGAVRMGAGLFYVDPLINLLHRDEDMSAAAEMLRQAKAVIDGHTDYEHRAFYSLLMEINATKAEIMHRLPLAYEAGDRAYMRETAEKTIPRLLENYRAYYALFRRAWEESYKPFGLEKNTQRMGGVMLRLEDVAGILQEYADGARDSIPELEEKIVRGLNLSWRNPDQFMSTL